MLTAIAKEDPIVSDIDTDAEAPSKDLPLNLLHDDVLPTGRKATVVPMKGRVERAFFQAIQSKDPLTVLKGWNEMIRAITVSLDGKVPTLDDIIDMDEADRRTIMLMCRRRTYSEPVVTFNWRCAPPHVQKSLSCGKDNEQAVDISLLTYEKVVPPQPVALRSGQTLTAERPTGRSAEAYLKLRRGKETVDFTQMMIARQVKLDGERATEAQLDDLNGEEYAIVKREIARAYGPDAVVEAHCKHCQAQLKTNLETIPGFFFPGAGT